MVKLWQLAAAKAIIRIIIRLKPFLNRTCKVLRKYYRKLGASYAQVTRKLQKSSGNIFFACILLLNRSDARRTQACANFARTLGLGITRHAKKILAGRRFTKKTWRTERSVRSVFQLVRSFSMVITCSFEVRLEYFSQKSYLKRESSLNSRLNSDFRTQCGAKRRWKVTVTR